MSMAATAWAFSTECVQTPLERLLVILLADDTDGFGVCLTDLPQIAAQACMPLAEVDRVLFDLCKRGVLTALQKPADIDPDLGPFSFLLFLGWEDRDHLGSAGHPVLSEVASV